MATFLPGVILVCNRDINSCIQYVLRQIDGTSELRSKEILYVNTTFPNQLFNNINDMNLAFKSDKEFMKSFHYYNASNLQELIELLNSETKRVIIIESVIQIAELTADSYNVRNSLLTRLLVELRKAHMVYLLSSTRNNFLEYFVDDVVSL